jgi:hypothetical protein
VLLLPALALDRHSILTVAGWLYAIVTMGTIVGHWRIGRASLLAPFRILNIVAQAISRRGDSFGVSANQLIAAVGDSKIPRSVCAQASADNAKHETVPRELLHGADMREPYSPVDRA